MLTFAEFRARLRYDLVGVVPLDAYAKLPAQENPLSLFPDAKSIVVLGRRIRRGRFRAMEEGSLWTGVGRWLTGMDDAIRCIEREGYECVPFAPVDAPKMPRNATHPGQCRPNSYRIAVEYAAVAAGLGEIGYHGMFMSEQYGIRQSLGLLVTDLPIEPGPGVPAGRKPICDLCMECVQCCPLSAISASERNTLSCQGLSMSVGAINALACQACPNGVSGDSKYFAGAEELHFEVENNQVKGESASGFLGGNLPNRLAAACGRACIAHFEATHDTGYRLPFRIREPWGFRPDQAKEQ
jgi:epoxyqueuosine reductase